MQERDRISRAQKLAEGLYAGHRGIWKAPLDRNEVGLESWVRRWLRELGLEDLIELVRVFYEAWEAEDRERAGAWYCRSGEVIAGIEGLAARLRLTGRALYGRVGNQDVGLRKWVVAELGLAGLPQAYLDVDRFLGVWNRIEGHPGTLEHGVPQAASRMVVDGEGGRQAGPKAEGWEAGPGQTPLGAFTLARQGWVIRREPGPPLLGTIAIAGPNAAGMVIADGRLGELASLLEQAHGLLLAAEKQNSAWKEQGRG